MKFQTNGRSGINNPEESNDAVTRYNIQVIEF